MQWRFAVCFHSVDIIVVQTAPCTLLYTQNRRSRDSLVGIATGYGLDERVPVGSRIFSSPRRPDRLWGPPNLISNGYRGAISPGVKRQVREADHSLPASAEVKKMLIYTSTPIRLQGIVLNKLKAQRQLYLYL
jgi:hypothetical protein